MEKKLSRLFDYQKYAKNSELADILDDVDSRYPQARELSDDELSFVAAAGVAEDSINAKNKRPKGPKIDK